VNTLRKLIIVATAALVVGTPAVAQARPVLDEPYSGGVWVGEKQLCKEPNNWFERNVLMKASYDWVRCSELD